MARKHTIPGVDEAALSELARQFPSHEVEPPLSQDKARAAAGDAPVGRRGGGAVGAVALVVGLAALAVAAVPLVAPAFRAEITQALGDGPLVQALFQGRSETERALAAERAARTELERRLADLTEKSTADTRAIAGRVSAIEGVGGGGFDVAARRVEAAEAGLAAALRRVEAAETGVSQAKDGLGTLGQSLEAVKASLETVGTAAQANQAATDAALADLEQRALRAVEEKLAAIEEKASAIDEKTAAAAEQATKAGTSAGEALQKATQVEQNFGELRQFNRSSVRLFLIALHLRTAIQTPASFARELTAVRSVVGSNAEAVSALTVLTENANGVRTLADLRESFRATAGSQVKALAAGLDGSWTSRLTSMMAGPQPPRTGEGEKVWQVVVQAEQALAQGNLAAAINHVDRFDGAAGALVADWLRDAKARLAVENAAASLSIYALNQLVGGS